VALNNGEFLKALIRRREIIQEIEREFSQGNTLTLYRDVARTCAGDSANEDELARAESENNAAEAAIIAPLPAWKLKLQVNLHDSESPRRV
jgi:hypothetical protein